MTNPISEAAVDAAAEGIYERAYGQELPEAPIDLARAVLEAAMPEMRKQIASEIRAEMPALTTRAATQTLRVCMEHAARIAEKGTAQ